MPTQITNIIIGGGLTAVRALQQMRQLGFAGRIVLISEESHNPYDRPPLSKDVLLQGRSSHAPLHAESFYEDANLDLRLGARVIKINPKDQSIVLQTDEVLRFDNLLIATGASPRAIPVFNSLGDRVMTLRTLDDALKLRARLTRQRGHRLAVIGGGVLGLEIAASARMLGCQVSVLERLPTAMARIACTPVSSFLTTLHQKHGVELIFKDHVVAVELLGDSVVLLTEGGRNILVDTVVVAIGVQPNVELAQSAGLHVEDGICVDESCRTSHDHIFAAGDVVTQWEPNLRRYVRSEIWASAQEQGRTAATSMLTGQFVSREVPWFWTDQFETNIQMAGDLTTGDWVIRGDEEAGSYTLFGMDKIGCVVGAVTFNRGREMRCARMMIAAHATPSRESLTSAGTDLNRLAKEASRVSSSELPTELG